jgi:hypothetical protein
MGCVKLVRIQIDYVFIISAPTLQIPGVCKKEREGGEEREREREVRLTGERKRTVSSSMLSPMI